MIYQCTKDLLKALKVEKTDKPDIYNKLFSWSGKVMKVRRRNLVYLMNDASKLSVVLFGMTGKEFKNFDDHVKEGIREVLRDCDVAEDIIDGYLTEAGEGIFTSSGTRKQLGVLNNSALEAEYMFDEFYREGLLQRDLCIQQNQMIVKHDDGDYVTPKNTMKTLLEEHYEKKKTPFDLGEIALYMFNADDFESVPFLNIHDGSISVIERGTEEYEDIQFDEDYEMIETENFDFIYHFTKFVRGLDHEEFLEKAYDVEAGKGAIRRLKDLLSRYPDIQKQWYEYEEEAQEREVKEWLESRGLI